MSSCYLIGTTGTLIKCAELLMKYGYNIKGIISSDGDICRFAKQKHISIHTNISDASAILKTISFDYLFSIANPKIIPDWLLRKVQKLAINYHDAPLPKYAGVHATSWAILNQEQKHGITWHEMVQKADAGNILKQKTFSISPDDTTLSLNLRCYEHAVKAFEEMLCDLEEDRLVGIEQNLSDRSYYKLHQKPLGGGILDWKQDTAYINRLSRALYFGNYPNNFTRPKIVLPNNLILYPNKIEIVDAESNLQQIKPGIILAISEDSIKVSCRDGIIKLQELYTSYDHRASLNEVREISALKEGDVLPLFNQNELGYFTYIMEGASEHNFYWQSQLKENMRVNLPWVRHAIGNTTFKRTITFSKKKSRVELITYILTCLNKFTNSEVISFYYTDKDDQKKINKAQGLICPKIYNIFIKPNHSIKSLIQDISRQLNYVKESNKSLGIDTIYNASETPNVEITLQSSDKSQCNIFHPDIGIKFVIACDNKSIDCITAKTHEAQTLLGKLQEYFSILQTQESTSQPLGSIALNTEEEVQKLNTWNNTIASYSRNKAIHELFEEQVERAPDNIAVVYEDVKLTYKELNKRANRLANYLKDKGVCENTLVAVALERSPEMVISLLAILKVGGVYIPLDLEYPDKRLSYILEDTKAEFLVTTFKPVSFLSSYQGSVIDLNHDQDAIATSSSGNLKHSYLPAELVYIIYTSGTTGKPKGVGNTHQGLLNRLLWTLDYYTISSRDSFLYIASSGFDISVWEILFPLTGGASLIIPLENQRKDIYTLIQIINKHRVTSIHFVPSYLSLFIDNIKGKEDSFLRYIITGGEAVTNELQLKYFSKLKNTKLYLAYGPTEAAISITHMNCMESNNTFSKTLIGKPISNTEVYILDRNLNQIPIGAIGELYIGGVGLARGYLNRAGLTAERFIANPFCKKAGERLYKTGDLARYLSDGNIEYIGRIDQQVKIRGFRIELGEIESVIASVEGVKQCVVLAREDEAEQKKVVAYVVAKVSDNKEIEGEDKEAQQELIGDIRKVCAKNLPDYMEPSQVMVLKEMPLTPNGKIDRKGLPKPEGREGLEAYEAPEGKMEKALALIWKELLQVGVVGRNDNFFHLGGDSIIGINMLSQGRKVGIIFDVQQIFATPTIAEIVANSRTEEQESIEQNMMVGSVPLLPVQEFFFAQKLTNVHHYNQSMWFLPTFKLCSQDKEKLKNCIKSIYNHHDTLRLRYNLHNSSSNSKSIEKSAIPVVQYYHEDNPFFWEEVVINIWNDDSLFLEATKKQRDLDIVSGPTSKVVWFESRDGYQGMLWIIHHLLIDGVSWRILLNDLNTLFDDVSLPYKTHSYQAFSNYLKNRNISEKVINYYQNVNKINYTILPTDFDIKKDEAVTIQHFDFKFSKNDTLDFIQNIHASYNTQANDILITALILAIGSYKGTYDLLLSIEGHGREGDLNISKTLGWFTSVYPTYIKVSDLSHLSGCIKEVKEQLRAIPERGIGYGICISQKVLSPIRVDLIFNYLGQWDTAKDSRKYFNFGYNSKGVEVDVRNKPPCSLMIESGIQDGVLSVKFSYSNEYNKSTIIKIANSYKASLKALLTHCTNINNYGRTPSDFALIKLTQKDIDSLFKQSNIQDLYPLTPMQSGLIFQYQLNPNSDEYFVQSILEVDNILNVQHLKDAWQIILERYECLRSSFAYKALDNPVQIIYKSVDILWKEIDISYLTSEEQEQVLENTILQERQEGFDIQKPPLLRFNLLRKKQNSYYLVWNQHHLLTGGWSMPIILSEVTKAYESLINSTSLKFKSRRPYKDYIAWINKQDRSKAIAYWSKELLNTIPSKIGKEVDNKANYTRETLTLSEHQSNALAKFAKDAGVTLNTVFQAVWSLILSQHTRQNEVVFGVTVSGRNISLSGIEGMVGIFINTVPLKVEIRPYESLQDFLQRIQRTTSAHQNNSYLPLSEIQAITERDLFDSIFVFENYPLEELDPMSADLTSKRLHLKLIKLVEKIEYPVGIMVCPGKQIHIYLNYKDSYCTHEKIGIIKEGIISICERLQESNIAVGNITSVSYDTIIKLLHWNNTKADYPKDKCIYELFEEQVEKTPHSIAIIYENQRLTYQQLNEKANQLAHYLKSFGVGPDTLVAISVKSSLEIVVGLLGILKAGGVYIPLDPEYPQERLQFMLEDAKASLLLTQTDLVKQFTMYKGAIVLLDKEKNNIAHLSTLNPNSYVSPSNLAYIIFTSGSTGRPNGVMVGHKQLVNLIISLGDLASLQQGDSFVQNVSFSFDPSLWSTLWPLTQGAYIVLPHHSKLREPEHIIKLFIDHSAKILHIGPTLFRSLISIEHIKNCKSINHIIGGGEEWKHKDLQDLSQKLPHCYLSNVYGPTEATIQVLTWRYKGGLDSLSVIPIGKPISNTEVYILDRNLNQIPIGAIGELYIGGVGLARGYLNRAGLTAERFIANPFCKKAGERLYKTGDLARYLSDGNIEYIGRIDQQVKIRGFRIELGEIESVIASVEGVKQCVVLAREDEAEQKKVVAYVVAKVSDNKEIEGEDKEAQQELIGDIRKVCAKNLPDYMEPSQVMVLKEMPLTPNGKIDRKGLPKPEGREGLEAYEAPEGKMEKALALIWKELLQVGVVGRNDNFFHLGGHSLIATRLISKIRQNESIEVPLRAIFEYPVLCDLADIMEQKYQETGVVTNISPTVVTSKQEQLLSYAQERLWFIEKYEGGSNAYNVPMIFSINEGVGIEFLRESIRAIVERHEILRSVIREDGKEGIHYQEVIDIKEEPFEIEEVKYCNKEELEKYLEEEANHIFDLGEEYPIRVKIYSLEGGRGRSGCILSVIIHHIAFDGWSVDIFLKEVKEYYKYYKSKGSGLEEYEVKLPELSIQYKDFALWQRGYLTGEVLDNQLSYWKGELEGYETLQISTDYVRPAEMDYEGKEIRFEIDEKVSVSLREIAKELGVSLYSLMLSGYYLMLKGYSGQEDIVIGMPVANRHYMQIEDLIGFFVNTLALRVEIGSLKNKTLKEFIKYVGSKVIEGQVHQDLPFEKLVEELQVAKDTSRHPIFQVIFELRSFSGNEDADGNNKLLEPYVNDTKEELYKIAKFDIETFIDDRDNSGALKGLFNYRVSLYKEESIKRLISIYKTILGQIAKVLRDREKKESFKIDEISYLTKEEENLIVNEWNKTTTPYPENKTIHKLFEEQVEKTPDNIAVVYEHIKLTYKELNQKANNLAHYLINMGVNNTLVIIALEKSIETIIGFFAVLKAGGAYVPINPQEPEARTEYIFNDTKAPIIITNTEYVDSLPSTFAQIICLDEMINEISNLPVANPQIQDLRPKNLAYVIYTSGTTGKPKGVMIEHRSVINYKENVAKYINLTASDKVDCSTNIGFDLTVTTTICSFLSGAEVILYSGDIKDVDTYKNHLCANSINVIKLVPSYFELIADILPQTQIRKVILGGEKLDKITITKLLDMYKSSNLNKWSLEIYDEYGPTETTVGSCINKVIADVNESINLSIGKAYDNYTTYILSPSLTPLPIGAIGELYIGGTGLARGYLNRAGLTAERFIANPFCKKAGERLYKTGDLARYLSDGNIEYIGRVDHQVKIRGFRIELGEIESVLLSHTGIKQCVVLAKERNTNNSSASTNAGSANKYLVAYYTIFSEYKLDENEIISYLSSRIPDYMIPNAFVWLEVLPLTVNGKLCRKALPDPEFGDSKDNYVAPRNEIESKLCSIWEEVLGLSSGSVGINDDFFRLGGNSTLAIKLVSSINRERNLTVNISDIFRCKTVESFAKSLEGSISEDTIEYGEI